MGRNKSRNRKTRFTLVLTDRTRKQLDDLQVAIDADSMSEVVRRAIALYKVVNEHQAKGWRVVFEGPEGERDRLL